MPFLFMIVFYLRIIQCNPVVSFYNGCTVFLLILHAHYGSSFVVMADLEQRDTVGPFSVSCSQECEFWPRMLLHGTGALYNCSAV